MMILFKHILVLTRPSTALSGILATLVGWWFAGGTDVSSLIFAMLAVACVQTAGNVHNNVVDRLIDAQLKPKKAAALEALSPQLAQNFSIALAALSIPFGWLSAKMLGVAVVVTALILLYLYNATLRKTWSGNNLIVGVVSAGAPLMGALSTGTIPWMPVAIVFLTITVREVIKDLNDWKIDEQYGYTNLIIVYSEKIAINIVSASIVFLILFLLTSALYFTAWYAWPTVFVALSCVGLLTYLVNGTSEDRFEQLSNAMKALFFVWFVGVIIGV